MEFVVLVGMVDTISVWVTVVDSRTVLDLSVYGFSVAAVVVVLVDEVVLGLAVVVVEDVVVVRVVRLAGDLLDELEPHHPHITAKTSK